MSAALTLVLLGQTWEVEIPRSFATREDLLRVGGPQVHRGVGAAAIIGQCTRLGRLAAGAAEEAGEVFPNYLQTRRALDYGVAMYDFLRSEGATIGEICDAAEPLRPLLRAGLFPTILAEAKDKEVFSGAPPAGGS